MKIVKWTVIVVFILIIVTPIALFGYVQFKFSEVKRETYHHLMEQGYDQADIQSIEAKIKKLSLYTAEVIFVDEPDIIYDYKLHGGTIIQLNPNALDEDYQFKHKESSP